jgi:hypothetical protein
MQQVRNPFNIADEVRWFSEHSALRTPMVRTISANQREKPSIRILAPALTLMALCDSLGLNVYDVLGQVRRATSNIDGPFSREYGAMVDYARGEILKGD